MRGEPDPGDSSRVGVDAPSSNSSSLLPDADLIHALQAHSLDSVALLYDRYGRLIYTIAFRVMQDRSTAEEITQDVILRCWNNIDQFRPSTSSFKAWLVAIAHHRAIDEIRSRRNQEQRRSVSDEHLRPLAREDPHLDLALIRGDIVAGLALLPPEQRQAVEMVYWRGLSRRETAEALHIPLGTVHTRLRLAMEKLRQTFRHLFDDP